MRQPIPRMNPVPILLTNYNRLHFLKRAVERINEDTLYPFYLIVVDNNSTDGSRDYIKSAKVNGKIFDHLLLQNNNGQSSALNEGLKLVEYWHNRRRPMDDFVVTTNEDIFPPHLKPCWLERMLHLFKKYEKDGLGALAMRIQRTPRADIDEEQEIIYWKKGIPSVYRLMRRSDLALLGEKPFGELRKWDSNATADRYQFFIKKRYGLATHLYADHAGFMEENKGYDPNDTSYFTYAANKTNAQIEKPYPIIDGKSNIPLEITHGIDTHEQAKRRKYWGQYGRPEIVDTSEDREIERKELEQYVTDGNIVEIGVGKARMSDDITTVDVCPRANVDMIARGDDLWWLKDGEVDGVVSTYFVERIADTKALLIEWSRILAPGGILAFTCYDADNSWKNISDERVKAVLTKNILEYFITKVLGHKIIRLENLANGNIICVSQKSE